MLAKSLRLNACAGVLLSAFVATSVPPALCRGQEVSLGGFIPLVGIGMTDESKSFDDIDLGGIPFIADPATFVGAPLLGNGSPYFDIALFDSGAATHFITQQAFNGFDIQGNGLRGTQFQDVGGATGVIVTEINDAAGIYAAGLGDRTSAGAALGMNTSALRGQTSIATLTAPDEWTLPNILGLPMAAHHAVMIRNDQPQIFQHQQRTVRTPQIEFIDLGTGAEQGIQRRAPLLLRPGIGFIQGPQYVFNLDIDDILLGGGDIDIANNPASPSVVQDSNGNGGGLFMQIDLSNDGNQLVDKELLFDTGADLTVVSELIAKRLGFDAVLDTPDFTLQVEGSGGVSDGVPGFYLDEWNIDAVGGSFTLQNVPIAVLDVTNPNDPGNIIDGIIGMHLFNGRNLVIDANPSIGQGGVGPSLFISDPVTEDHTWSSATAVGDWSSAGNWTASGSPSELWVARATASGAAQTAEVSTNSTVFKLLVSGGGPAEAMTVDVQTGATLTVFGEAKIDAGGEIRLTGGTVDAQFINIEGGVLAGSGDIFVGAGPLHGAVRNISGRVAPGEADVAVGDISIVGDLVNLDGATLAFDLGGTSMSQYDQIDADRFAFLDGILEVSLIDLGGGVFNPTSGNSFTLITADEGIVGQFDQLLLPAGFQWDVDYFANSVVLEVLNTIEILAGDFDSNGVVDGNDLAAWEAGFGATYSGGDFLTWQRNFGAGGTPAGAVPEPAACLLAALAVLSWLAARSSVFRTLRS